MDFKTYLSSHIHYDEFHTYTPKSITSAITFPSIPEKAPSSLHLIRACYQGCINAHIRYSFSSMPYYVLIFTSSGSCRLFYDNSTYTLTSGSIAFLDLKKTCMLSCSDTDPWETTQFLVESSLCEFYFSIYYKEKHAVLYQSGNTSLSNRIHTLNTLSHSSSIQSTDLLISHKVMTDLLTTLTLDHDKFSYHSDALPAHITAAISYIHIHYAESLSLETIARQIHIGKYTLAHDFTSYIGTSVMDYVCSQRIEHGKLLLSTTAISVYDISYRLGFSSDAHFISTFKKRTGITPLQYRKRYNTHLHLSGCK